MGILGMAFSAIPGMTWIKLAGVALIAVAIGGLYWYGKHEAALVVEANKQIGADAQIIADDKANIGALTQANQNWANAFKKFQKDAADQQQAYQDAVALKEKINAQLAQIRKLLGTNPAAATAALNALGHRLICLLNGATSCGTGDGSAAAAAGETNSPAPARP